MKVLVTGGVRSGKSRRAEALLANSPSVTYVAPGPTAADEPDTDWAARIAAHQDRRPSTWNTVETHDLDSAIRQATGAVLIDCLGTWVTSLMDDTQAWEAPRDTWEPEVSSHIDAAIAAWRDSTAQLVAVTNEVGMGVVPSHRSGMVFRDLLGMVNQRFAAASDEVHLVVAGRTLIL